MFIATSKLVQAEMHAKSTSTGLMRGLVSAGRGWLPALPQQASTQPYGHPFTVCYDDSINNCF